VFQQRSLRAIAILESQKFSGVVNASTEDQSCEMSHADVLENLKCLSVVCIASALLNRLSTKSHTRLSVAKLARIGNRKMIDGDSARYYHYHDLVQYAKDLVSTIAQYHLISGVAGVPRSGMLAASAAAIHLGVPLFEASMDGIRDISHGRRLENFKQEGRIVVMEDSMNSGVRFWQLRQKLGNEHIYAAVFSTPRSIPKADYVHVSLPLPHWFDWWLWGSKYLLNRNWGIDFDGILCDDCPREKDTDDAVYEEWMRTVRPIRHARPFGVPVVITGRLERYRGLTEEWLRRNRQEVKQVVFGPWKSASERRGIADYKAQKILRMDLAGFVESDHRQALRIAEVTKRPVVCPAANRTFQFK